MKAPPSTITQNAAWMLAGTAVYAASQWAIAVVLARLGGPEAVGVFAFGSAISMPIIVISQLALRQVLITDIERRHVFGDYLRLRLSFTGAAFLGIACLTLSLGYQGEALLATVCIAAGRCFESVSDIHYGRLQRDERLDLVAQFAMVRGVLCVVAVIAAYNSTLSIAIAGLAFAVACAVSTIFVSLVGQEPATARELGVSHFSSSRALAVVALPLAASQFFSNLNGNAPRLVLEYVGGSALLGEYAVVEHFIAAVTLIVQAVGQASAPRLALLFATGKVAEYSRLVRQLFAVFVGTGSVGTIFAFAFGPALVEMVYGSGFEEAQRAFAWLMSATTIAFAASVLGYAVTATGRFRGLGWRYALIAAITTAAALALTPNWGLIGLAGAIAIGSTCGCVLPAAFLWSAIKTAPRPQQ